MECEKKGKIDLGIAGYRPIYIATGIFKFPCNGGLCHRYVKFIVGRLLSHWERYIGVPTTDDLGIFRF